MTPDRLRRVEELFHAARERPAGDRAAFLERECAGDAPLRHEVESLLAQPDGALLAEGVGPVAAALAASSAGESCEGRRLGPYMLGPLLGRGGMGDVYRARDSQLDREVAIKIVPDALAGDPDRLTRFEREAHILASLNHPNIAAIYGLQEGDGLRGLVLELVEGVTLKERLDAGRLPLHEALAIARQIASALEAAHRKGVVHRDLKPANVKIGLQGLVKVLDFGLAKMDAPGPAALGVLATGAGIVLGTVAYMSPEQARGAAVDKRTDIWAFGCVLFEMLTGGRPFPGETAADVLGRITSAEPDWALLPAETPRRVRRLLQRCLAKDPDRRLHDVADARLDIDDALAGDIADRGVPMPAGVRVPRGLGLWIAGAALVIAATAAAWLAASDRSSEGPRPARLSVALPPDVALFAIGRGSSVAVSPDGQRIAYAGVESGRRQLYMRSLEGFESVPIAGTEGGANPFFSPDGRWLGFTDGPPVGGLKKVPVAGGAPVLIVDRDGTGLNRFGVQGAAWGADDTIIFGALNDQGLWRVPGSGGRPERLTTPRDGELTHTWPEFLPGGQAVLFTVWSNTGFHGGRLVVQPLPTGERRTIVEGASFGRVVVSRGGPAYLVFARPDGLHAAPFDLERLALAGPAVRVVEGVFTNLSGGAHFSVSASGILAYIPGGLEEQDKTAVWVGRDGGATEIGVIPGLGFQSRLSPDGRRLVYPNAIGPTRDLWVEDLDRRGVPARLTVGGIMNTPVWTPDGRDIIYGSGLPNANLFRRAADGTGGEERLTSSANRQIPGSVSPDGATLVYSEADESGSSDLWLLPLQGSREPRLLLGTPFVESKPRTSPDGRWVAYQSNRSGRFEVYLTPLSGGGRQYPVSEGGGWNPLWAPDGRELYYRTVTPEDGGDMMAVPIDLRGAESRIGRPRLLFPSPYHGEGDVAPDGRFFLLERTPVEARSRVIHLVLNWFDDLKARVPAP